VSDLIEQFTALPNLHPALVHFPIALLPVAVLFDGLSYWRARGWLSKAATTLYALAALGAWTAYEAGEDAADSLGIVAPHIQLHVNEHSDFGRYTLWLLGGIALARIGLDLWDRHRKKKPLRVLLLVIAVGGIGLLTLTADLGGGLVYQHGIGVAEVDDHGVEVEADGASPDRAPPAREPRPDARTAAAESRLVTEPNGAVLWRPLGSNRDALGSVLTSAEGSDLSAVSWLEPDDEREGLRLLIDGEAWLVLPGSFGDVQVELEVGLERFEGQLGPVHHIRGAGNGGFFLLEAPAGEFVLGSIEAGAERELDRASGEVPTERVRMTVSAIGRHLKGLLANETVVHGHEPAMPDGACGLLVRGKGTLSVVSMKVTPAE
jgi:uncharacterized membrane protein